MNLKILQNFFQAFFHNASKTIIVVLLLAASVSLSGCSGKCQAGGSNYGGKVLCNALDF
jgi:hypothetical protein